MSTKDQLQWEDDQLRIAEAHMRGEKLPKSSLQGKVRDRIVAEEPGSPPSQRSVAQVVPECHGAPKRGVKTVDIEI